MPLVNTEHGTTGFKFKAALFVLGFTTLLAQLVTIREFLNVFQGNELIIGLNLFIWMIITAAGSFFGAKNRSHKSHTPILFLMFCQGGFPLVSILALHLTITLLFPYGTAKGFAALAGMASFFLFPVCFTSGMLFSRLTSTVSRISGENRLSECYGRESAGSILAGLSFSLGLGQYFSAFQILSVLVVVNLASCLLIFNFNKIGRVVIIAVVAIFTLLTITDPLLYLIRSMHFRDQRLVYTRDTPYGNISVTETSGQFNVFENGNLYFSSQNTVFFEEAVHFALMQSDKPAVIMIASGGMSGMIKQALKYPSIEAIHYVDINPWLIQAEKMFFDTVHNMRVSIIIEDARRTIGGSPDIYDAIIINAPDPINARINTYYTKEFFVLAKKALREGGVFEISLTSTINYINDQALAVNGIVYHTLKEVFRNVEIIPGVRNYFLASDRPLRIGIAEYPLLSQMENDYVNSYYIQDDLLTRRSREIKEQLNETEHITNLDLSPVAYFAQIAHWMVLSEGDRTGSIIIVSSILLLVILLYFLKGIDLNAVTVFSTSFAAASAEFMLLMVFQILFGHVYLMMGLIVACYMTGLTAGSLVPVRKDSPIRRIYNIFQVIMLFLVIVIPLFAGFSGRYGYHRVLSQPGLYLITAAIAFSSGIIFNAASRNLSPFPSKNGRLYGIDLAGAAAGMLITAVFLFPVGGIWGTSVLISVMIILTILAAVFKILPN